MSLSSFIETNPDVCEYLRTAFKKPRLEKMPPLVVPPRANNPSLVGTAFDYLTRLMLRRENPSVTERESWVADGAVTRITSKAAQKRALDLARKSRDCYNRFVKTGDLTQDVMVASIHLAQLDIVFRTGDYADRIGESPDQEDIEDLRALAAALPLEQLRAKTRCFLNPTFGDASRAIGGADADLIIDDALLDIKVRKTAEVRGEDFQALVGYYLLYEIGGIEGVFYLPRITRVGFYFARHQLLQTWQLADLVGTVSIDDTVLWLRRRLGLSKTPEKDSIRKARRSM